TVALKAAETYRMTLTSQYPARWYLFGASCVPAQINAACAKSGIGGDLVSTTTASKIIKPSADGTYTIAIDARSTQWFGDFSLSIETFTPPTNGVCASPSAITLLPAGQTTTIKGDTTGAANEFGNAITCGVWGGVFDGPQLYYTLKLQATRTYTFAFHPAYSRGRLYLARAKCDGQAINTDCASQGKDGFVLTPSLFQPSPTTTFKPAADGTYLMVVDSTDASGAFTVDIK
ncbi:MAG: hypothetical protein KAI47_13130, partial [Deltaproteobacteria bacterium]|nr:hypothetical protein [Deltaproteobacteria bacterium]